MRKILALAAFLFTLQTAHAQVYFEEPLETDAPLSLEDRIYFSGNLSLNFGTFTMINVSPLAGYLITKDFSVGIVANYIYVSR